MWSESYADRLREWNLLRDRCRDLPLDPALITINQWWHGAPLTVRTVIWEHHTDWPDPWRLLAQDRLCDLARALGMLYTVMMTEHFEIVDCRLAQTDHDNLVLVNQGKYILNWHPDQVLNIPSQAQQVCRSIDSIEFVHHTR
jgi:hypothetical protein